MLHTRLHRIFPGVCHKGCHEDGQEKFNSCHMAGNLLSCACYILRLCPIKRKSAVYLYKTVKGPAGGVCVIDPDRISRFAR